MSLPHRLLAAVLLLTAVPRAPALTTNVLATADTFILSGSPNNNAGAHTHATAGRDFAGNVRRALFRFDLAGIPPGSTITSATLRISVAGPIPGPPSTFDIMRVVAPWGEGTKPSPVPGGNAGTPADFGECTWISRMHSIAAWFNPGGDFDAAPLASTAVFGGATYTWSGMPLTLLVQFWVDAPDQNAGLLLRTQSEGTGGTVRQFGTREGGNPAQLEIGFTPPPQPLFRTITTAPTNVLTLSWSNQTARRYDVLYTATLTDTQSWRIAESDIPAAPSGTNVWTDPPIFASPRLPGATNFFYSLRELPASPEPLSIVLDPIATNLTAPTVITHANDNSDRLFIAEQLGQIRILDMLTDTLLPTPFLDLSSRMTNLANPFGPGPPGINPAYDERGLLGLAFHPEYEFNGRFFVFYNAPKSGPGIHCESIVSEFSVSATNANLAEPATEQVILRFDKPEFNHNGGDITFGPDGYLYIPTGDGGGAGDQHPPHGNAQSLTNLLGKILRIDVDTAPPYTIPPDNPFASAPPALPEIYAYGLRNPWKVAFDGTNLWVADVGQNLWEEINIVRSGGNYGWRITEGKHAFDLASAPPLGVSITALDYPIHAYPHGPLGISIIGGYVYRGSLYDGLLGCYVFGDFSTGFAAPDGALYYLQETRPNVWERFTFEIMGATSNRLGRYVKCFGQGPDGELYLGSTLTLGPSGTSGDVRRILPP